MKLIISTILLNLGCHKRSREMDVVLAGAQRKESLPESAFPTVQTV
ncbi:hypothetical protein [Coraliomargarita parva]|nr:hypothetical protein [Coraliomargarita parva]